MERAAPIPVPVHMRMPRLYSVDVLETPANWKYSFTWEKLTTTLLFIPLARESRASWVDSVRDCEWNRLEYRIIIYKSPSVAELTYLVRQRSCSGILRAGSRCLVTVMNMSFNECSMHSRNNSESVIFHDRGATDSSKKPLLHPPLESNDSYFCWRLITYF